MRRRFALSIAGVLAVSAGYALFVNAGVDVHHDLISLGDQLRAQRHQDDGFFMLRTQAELATEALKLPKEYGRLNQIFSQYLAQSDYLAAARTADQMERLLPRRHTSKYPLSQDFLIEWRAEVGNLKMLGGDFEGAAADYRLALQMDSSKESIESPRIMAQDIGKQLAAYDLARLEAIKGHREVAMKLLSDAPGYYWSGCGNCAESTAQISHRDEVVWSAACLPYAAAKPALAKIIHGRFRPLPARLNLGSSGPLVQEAQTEAAFMLGEIAKRQGDLKLAKECFLTTSMAEGEIGQISKHEVAQLH